jgi:dTDP-4-dehydrorhamnose 3,5-epimerase-like enzyme
MSSVQLSLQSLNDVRWIDLPGSERDDGQLIVMQGMAEVPFALARVFIVRAADGATRGRHAHRLCSQLLVCVSGAVEVVCDDASRTSSFVLDSPKRGLLVPPTIWAQQNYRQAQSVLMVLCDRPYEPEDYIRDYAEFEALRAPKGLSANRSVSQ